MFLSSSHTYEKLLHKERFPKNLYEKSWLIFSSSSCFLITTIYRKVRCLSEVVLSFYTLKQNLCFYAIFIDSVQENQQHNKSRIHWERKDPDYVSGFDPKREGGQTKECFLHTHKSWIKRKHILSNPFMKRVREYDEDDDEKKHSWVSERETQV